MQLTANVCSNLHESTINMNFICVPPHTGTSCLVSDDGASDHDFIRMMLSDLFLEIIYDDKIMILLMLNKNSKKQL